MKTYLFISIPRTGTNSVRKSLNIPRDQTNHKTAVYLRDMYGLNEWNSRFKFSFVRNPYDRLVSYFRFCKTIFNRLTADQKKLYEGSFHKWVLDGCPHHFSELLGDPIHMDAYLLNEGGKMIVDFVGKVESFERDFALVCDQLEVPRVSLQHVNRSKRRHDYRGYYTAQTRRLVEKLCERDLALFRYSF